MHVETRNEEVIFIESENGIHSTTHRKNARTVTYNVPNLFGTARNLPKYKMPIFVLLATYRYSEYVDE